MMNKKAFTLIEMLIVIVLMGIIMTLAIPSVMQIMDNNVNNEMKTAYSITEQAAKLYKYRYRGEFNNNPNAKCYILNYQTLLDEKLLEENDIHCSGIIYYPGQSKSKDNQKYYLNCTDKNGGIVSQYAQSDVPTGCINLDVEEQEIEENTIAAPIIQGGNSDWVSTNIAITLKETNSSIAHYEYYISDFGNTPSRYQEPTGTTGNEVTISQTGIYYIWYRGVDNNGNVSAWSNREIANIDKETPTLPVITASDNIASGNLHTKDFVLTFGGGENISGNSYYWGTTSNPTTMATSIAITPEYNGKRIYVKSCSGANICSDTKSYVVNIEIPEQVDPALIE